MPPKSSIIKPLGDKDFYNKKIPKTTKYSNVKSTLDTGLTLSKLKSKIGEAHLNARFRRQENFQRIKRAQLTQIMQEDTIVFLLLDLRDKSDYEQCHIANAVSYPAPNLTRSVNPFVEVPQILEYQNKEDRLIIVYDYSEDIAPKTCNLFFEKGFDNVIMLSGGLKHYADKYAFLVQGQIPQPEKKKKRMSSGVSGAPSVASSRVSVTTTGTQMTRLATSLAKSKANEGDKKPAFK